MVDLIEEIPEEYSNANFWKLPVVGNISALSCIFVRPDGFVAWAQSVDKKFDDEELTQL